MMPYEEVPIITPLHRLVTVRLKPAGEDIWDTSIVYVRQVRRVGKFQGKDKAMEAAVKMAEAIADAPATQSATPKKKEKLIRWIRK
jgi:hypothetical protein